MAGSRISVKDIFRQDKEANNEELEIINEFLNQNKYELDNSNKYIGTAENKNLIILTLNGTNHSALCKVFLQERIHTHNRYDGNNSYRHFQTLSRHRG